MGLAEPDRLTLAKRALLQMRAWRWFGRAAGAALAVLAGLTPPTGPAAAQRADWMRALGPAYGGPSGPEPSEREILREWEINPAKGLPTLSPGNAAAMKAAIARYAAIAAKGGWRRLPDA